MHLFRASGFLRFSWALVLLLGIPYAGGQSKPASTGTIKIGFLIDSLKIERWQTDLEKFQKRASQLGATVVGQDAEGDDDLQLRQAQKLLDDGVRAIVLVAHDAEKADRIVRAAKAKHVPLICYDRMVRDPDVSLYVGFDSSVVGSMQAQSLTQAAPKGNYVLIAGSPSDTNALALHDAHLRVLKPFVDRGEIKIVSDTWSRDWNPTEAYAHMTEAIDATKGDITAVVASNDGTAGGAIQALEEHKLAGKALVSGQDADLAAIIRILDGTQTMTVYKPLGSQARVAAEAVVALAKGEAIRSAVPFAVGEKTVPAILLTPVVVTKDNVKETVIKDGFQNLETIRKSLPKEKWPK